MADNSPGPSSSVQFTHEQGEEVRNLELCIICQCENDNTGNSKLASTEEGRTCIINTSRLLQDDLLNNVTENELSTIKYHSRTCFSTYRKKGERFMKRRQTEGDHVPSTESLLSSPTSRPKRSKIADSPDPSAKPCIVCNHIKHKGITERFRICEANLAANLLQATSFNKDQVHTRVIFLKTVKDVFKEDVMYHDRCMKRYILAFQRDVENLMTRTYDGDGTPQLESVFKNLVDSIDVTKQGYALSDLRDVLNNQLKNHGKIIFFGHPNRQNDSILV